MGPGFKHDALVYGARLLDITPTILNWFGLPVGEDMEGRVLSEAFVTPAAVETIPSWENADGLPPRASALTDNDQQAVLDQFVALGYLNALPDDPSQAAAETERENNWNLARACMDGGRLEHALPLLEAIYFLYPERPDYAQTLARCQLRLGLLAEAEATLAACLDGFGDTETAHLIRANIALEQKDPATALVHLAVIRSKQPKDLQLLALLGRTLLNMRRWAECVEVCQTALTVDPDNALARLGLTRCALAQKQPEQAVHYALEAIGLQYGNPQGHFLLGVALLQTRQFALAANALRVAIKLAPQLFVAYRYLTTALRELGEEQAAWDMQLTLLSKRVEAAKKSQQRVIMLRAEAEQRDAHRRSERQSRRAQEQQRRAAVEASTLSAGEEFVLVSGLPRSGTSVMMQMLHAGGLAAMTDGLRQADEDNPEGYLEWEAIKLLPQQPLIIEQAQGRAIKVISALLAYLPPKHRYKIIFMRRPVEQVVSSQWQMLDRKGDQPRTEREHLQHSQSNHVEQLLQSLRHSERIELIEIDYPSLVAEPTATIARVVEFLGQQRLAQWQNMAACIKPTLYRNR
jgi:tetratricopeptide (TPR) repeat protein